MGSHDNELVNAMIIKQKNKTTYGNLCKYKSNFDDPICLLRYMEVTELKQISPSLSKS